MKTYPEAHGADWRRGERYSQRICRTLKFIHENYGRDISVQDAAEVLGLNGEYLNKLFKKEVNQSFSRYLTGFRMNLTPR